MVPVVVSLPRMRGDDPANLDAKLRGTMETVCPACAGMIRKSSGTWSCCRSLPRMRGDDPTWLPRLACISTFAPHARG